MKNIYFLTLILAIGWLILSCKQKNKGTHPSIYLVKYNEDTYKSVGDLKKMGVKGRQGEFLQKMIEDAEKDLQLPYIDPSTDFEGRNPVHLKHKNVSYDMAVGLSNRLSRSALLFLRTGEEKYKSLVIKQIDALSDTSIWPMWCDDAHVNQPPNLDIRTCRISMWVALCYNWLYDYLSEEERASIIEVLDKRAIQPFWQKIAQKPGWLKHRHNWFTNIYGGMGITAMALGKNHPETTALLDTIVPAMIEFNDVFGAMGEFNEPPGYAGAVRFSVEFAEAYRFYTKNKINLLNQKPFPDICHWMMYHTLPPGRIMAFGDSPEKGRPRGPEVIAATANANKNGILQWYYLHNYEALSSPIELLWFNPDIKPIDPEGKLSLGKEYKQHGASLISRTSWNQDITHCVVYGKAGRETNHDDNDVGQLLIDGFGERLIIDCGPPKPIYPKDYFRDTIQYNYYSRSSRGHNVLVIGDNEMKSEPNDEARGKTIKSWFRDSIGSCWKIDLTPVYENAINVTRSVIHLFPGVVLVHDYAILRKSNKIDLRWHTISKPMIRTRGIFEVKNDAGAVSAAMVSLTDDALDFSTGYHEYRPPYHLTRQGDPLIQDYEPYIQASLKSDTCSILTLFAVMKNEDVLSHWRYNEGTWTISVKQDQFQVVLEEGEFKVTSLNKPQRSLAID